MGRVTRRSVASKEETTPKESPKSAGRRGAKKEEPAVENVEGGSKDTPRKRGRQTAKEEQKADVHAKGKSADKGRSTSRGGRGKKEEEPEAAENEEEIQEEKTPRGSTRSRGKGKGGQEVKTANAAKGGRGVKAPEVEGKSEDNEERAEKEDEKEKETDQDSVKGRGGRARGKTSAVTPAARGDRRSRGRSAAEQESEEKMEEDSTDSKREDAETSKAVNEAETTPKGRQRRAANKETESSVTPSSSGGRRGRGQKAEPAPKTTPASGRSSRRGGGVAASTDETAEKKDNRTEPMDTGEEEKALPSEAAVDKEESSATEKATLEKEESSTIEKAAEEKEEPSTTEKAAQEKEEPSATETAAVEKEEASTSEMVIEESSEPVSSKKTSKVEGDEGSESPESAVPNRKRKLEDSEESNVAKQAKTDKKEPVLEGDDIVEGFVVVNKDDVPAPESAEVMASLPPEVEEKSQESITSEDTKQEDSTSQPVKETPPTSASDSPADAEISEQKDSAETPALTEKGSEITSNVDSLSSDRLETGSAVSLGSASVDQALGEKASEQVRDSSGSTTGPSQDEVPKQENAIPEPAEPALVQNNSSDAAPAVLQVPLAASQPQTFPAVEVNTVANQPAQPLPEAMEVDAEKVYSESPVHPALLPSQNGTAEESSLVDSDLHITSSPDKSQTAVRKAYVPSSTAIDSRKFILNPSFPVEMMDPAYCFSVVTYNILADCHLCRGDYSYTQPQYLVQDYRHSLLLKELDYLDGDIVCLQEVSPSYYTETLLPAMKSRGYDGHFIKRTKEYWDEGEATFVKTSKFDIVSHQSTSLSDLAFKEIDNSGLEEEIRTAAKKYLDRVDVILLTDVRCKKTGKTITVCNIHVVHDPKAPDVQCIQVACAVKQLVARAGSDQNPHIICGDFNSDAASPAYQLARDGHLSDDHIRRLKSLEALENTDGSSRALIHHLWGAFQHTSSNLKNAYELVLGKEPPVTVYTKSARSADHIFHSSTSIDNVGVLETLDFEVLEASGGLPSKSIPSDHLSIKAVFRLK